MRPSVFLILPLCVGALLLGAPVLDLSVRAVSAGGVNGIRSTLTDHLFISALERTLVLAVVVTVVTTVLGTVYAVAAVVASRPVRAILLCVVFGTFWISLLVRTLGWVILFEPNGALDQFVQRLGVASAPLGLFQTTLAMYPAMIHIMVPYVVLPVYFSTLRLDPDLLRAAQSLGGRPVAVVWHIVLPGVRASILAGSSLVFMLSLGFYITPLLLGGPSDLTAATIIDLEFHGLFDIGRAATMSVLLLLMVLAIYLLVNTVATIFPSADSQ